MTGVEASDIGENKISSVAIRQILLEEGDSITSERRSELLGRLGASLYNEGIYDMAVEAYTDAIKADSENLSGSHASFLERKAQLLSMNGFDDEALATIEKSLSLDSSSVDSYFTKARILQRKLGRGTDNNPVHTKAVIDALLEVIEKDPLHTRAMYSMPPSSEHF